MKKQLFVRLICAALLVGGLCGCGNTAKTGEPGGEEAAASDTSEAVTQPQAQLQAEELEDYTPIDPASVPVNAEGDFVFEVFEEAGTHQKIAFITGYIGTATQIHFPDSLGGCERIIINPEAFQGNENITYVYLPETVKLSNQYQTFMDCTALEEVFVSGLNKIVYRESFKNCSALRCVTLGEGAETIEPSVFRGCTRLTQVSFPSTVKSVGGSSFANCTSLPAVDLSQTQLENLTKGAFEGCTSLETVALPEGWELANWMDAFPDCPALKP